MFKKILITLAIFIPALYLSFVLISNQNNIGTNKDYVKKEYFVEGMTCKACEYKLKKALNSEFVSVESVNYDTKKIVLYLDPLNMSLTKINNQLASENYVLKLPKKGSLKVMDYQIKYN
ncbi:hypothetical protein CL657_00205 [bacterium]|nr:hypothetical protein [bacterium]|tara:strand:+ start:101 stop:457 length:357 start_codon:yes stop_codon:yes gene_type:complete